MQKEILEEHPDSDVRVYVVWFNMLSGDSRSGWDECVMSDPRATHLWDQKRLASRALAREVEGATPPVWDAYLLYGSEATWRDEPPRAISSGYRSTALGKSSRRTSYPSWRMGHEAQKMKVEILYFDGCPTYEAAATTLRAVLAEEGLETEVEVVAVNSDEEAGRLRFPGSPTIRVDGKDLFPVAEREDWRLGCRVYATPQGLRGSPTAEMLREALMKGGVGADRDL